MLWNTRIGEHHKLGYPLMRVKMYSTTRVKRTHYFLNNSTIINKFIYTFYDGTLVIGNYFTATCTFLFYDIGLPSLLYEMLQHMIQFFIHRYILLFQITHIRLVITFRHIRKRDMRITKRIWTKTTSPFPSNQHR